MTPAVAAPRAQQHPLELEQLVELYRYRRPQRVLELGVGEGGTLWHWVQHAPRGATVVAIDDRHVNAEQYRHWGRGAVRIAAILGDTADPAVIRAAADRGPYDFLFIDADHHDARVRNDWRNYGPMAAGGGIVAFHDVEPSDDPTVQVDGLWRELELEHETTVYRAQPGSPGIGVVFVEGES